MDLQENFITLILITYQIINYEKNHNFKDIPETTTIIKIFITLSPLSTDHLLDIQAPNDIPMANTKPTFQSILLFIAK